MKYHNIQVSDSDSFMLPEPESYSDCLDLIISDRYRLTGRRSSKFATFLFVLTHPFNLMAWYRLAHYRGPLSLITRAIYKMCRFIHKIDMPAETRAGWGLYLGHRMCMVVGGGTTIGNNVNLSQFVNIGTNHHTPAIIGSEVYIGPSACIVEDVRIGRGATVGAGAVVVHDVPAGSVCAGVPAKVLRTDVGPVYIANPWPVEQTAE